MEFSNILLRHQKSIVNSRKECNTSLKLGNNTFTIPVVGANMKSIITRDICKIFDTQKCFYVYHRIDGVKDVYKFTKWANKKLNITSISIGITEEWIELVKTLHLNNIKVDYFTVDVALSYTDNILPIIKLIKELYPSSFLIVGNGSTAKWVKWIGSLGLVDAIKIGIGVSKSCRTRQFTGFGSTTVSSLKECVEANKTLTKPMKIISDGGLSVVNGEVAIGDITKAVILGADMIMSGSVYSRCKDSPAIKKGYFGNASTDSKGEFKNVEGINVKVISSELSVKQTIKFIKESLQSSISYSGTKSLDKMKKKMYDQWDVVE